MKIKKSYQVVVLGLILFLSGQSLLLARETKKGSSVADNVGLFSQKEAQDLEHLWLGFEQKKGLNFSLLIVSDELPGKRDQVFAEHDIGFAKETRSVVFCLAHESRDIRIYGTPDLDSFLDVNRKTLLQDALISNFEKGWWKYGFEEASTRIVRKLDKKGGSGLTLSAAVWLWLVFGLAIIALILSAKTKNATTITGEGVIRRNILRSSPKEKPKGTNPDERTHFDGGGVGGSY